LKFFRRRANNHRISNFKPDPVTRVVLYYVVQTELGSRFILRRRGREVDGFSPPLLSLSTLRRKSVFGRDEAQIPEVERD
jgi:hypothetical protein